MNKAVATILAELLQRYSSLANTQVELEAAFDVLSSTMREGRTLFLCGNGGSAADCEHIAGELLKGFRHRRPLGASLRAKLLEDNSNDDGLYLATHLQEGLRAISLTGHSPLTSAIANDLGAGLVFAQQLLALARKEDALLCLSTSGNARNILLAVHLAHALGVRVLALTGAQGGKLAKVADIAIRVPETETFKIQELHLPIYHALCAMLEAERWGSDVV